MRLYPVAITWDTYHGEQVRIPIQTDDAERIQPLPQRVRSLAARK